MLMQNRGNTLLLRAISPDDSAWLAKTYANTEFVTLYCSTVNAVDEDTIRQSLIERDKLSPEQVGFIEYVIVHPKFDRIGLVTLGNYSPLHSRAEFLIGIVDPAHRHSMFSVEATLLTLDLAFNAYHLNKIFTYVYGYNEYSERNTVKFGFRQEGLLKEHHFCQIENRFVDLYINGMTLADFRNNERIAGFSRKLLGRDITLAPQRLQGPAVQEVPVENPSRLIDALRNLATAAGSVH
ncbi:GNAT family N-acetyltransferase [Parachitinimonas caeni]|uniref:GNAT family protein n=1 Tax=Parachitinimonas caeni TaxID=3031301 RepID=A0ABT7DT94_9NEIS|nr:GNAT family protein [Parachitinimonas caeni]MDK2123290.1 GNAT family protein [Parachitinimonas caeni]